MNILFSSIKPPPPPPPPFLYTQLPALAEAYTLLGHALLTGEWAGLSESLGDDEESGVLRGLMRTLAGETPLGYAARVCVCACVCACVWFRSTVVCVCV